MQTKPSSPPSAADSQTTISSQTSGLNSRQTVHIAEAVSIACDRDLNPAEQVKGLFCLMEKSGGEVQLLQSKNVINAQSPLSLYPSSSASDCDPRGHKMAAEIKPLRLHSGQEEGHKDPKRGSNI